MGLTKEHAQRMGEGVVRRVTDGEGSSHRLTVELQSEAVAGGVHGEACSRARGPEHPECMA